MLSINTNISSLVAQHSMKSATQLLNQAVERMTTGYKINHAKDNAANYSISQKMNMQISSFDVAADNVAMGMDLVTTASDIISNMQDKASRLQALCIQARNGTYGAQSIEVINSEAGAIMAEINRLYSTAEYNNISLFNRKAFQLSAEHQVLTETVCAKAEYNGFIEDPKTYTDAEVAAMTALTDDITIVSLGQKYSISNVDELVNLAELVNSGVDTTGVEFVLGADIDLSSISNWTPIGNTNDFQGNFDGNGHKLKNLTIDRPYVNYQGLFGRTSDTSEIKNVGLEGGSVKGEYWVGGLVGDSYSTISNCYTTGNVTGISQVGGLVGIVCGATITNCYTTGDVIGNNEFNNGTIGGLVGIIGDSIIENCYTTGNVSGKEMVGGLVGMCDNDILNSYSCGNVSGERAVGGLVGFSMLLQSSGPNGNIEHDVYTNCASYATVTGEEVTSTGSFIGAINGSFNGSVLGYLSINNCKVVQKDINPIGGYYDGPAVPETYLPDYDMTTLLAGINTSELKSVFTTLQVGINGDSSCRIDFDTNFDFDLSAIGSDISSDSALACINDFLTILSEKSTELGAVENRLNSALESIEVNIENLTSSLSTIRDADIAEVSSEYIRQQILQQASATLLSTANQSPSIALQLI